MYPMMTSQAHCHSTLYDFCNSALLSVVAKRKRIFRNLKKNLNTISVYFSFFQKFLSMCN